ncbi:dermonecrotic toxin domain-containing protein [Enterobacteriaceae bacterium LUAb1]
MSDIADVSAAEETDIWFDAREEVEAELTSARHTTEPPVPFSEDCVRCVRQLMSTLGDYKQNQILSACLTKMLPGMPASMLIAAHTLYTAITEKRNIDTAILHAISLASWCLPDDINIVAPLATFIRESITGWTDETFLQQLLEMDDNNSTSDLFTVLAVTAVIAKYWMTGENTPHRGFLRVPGFIANSLIRARYYWSTLGNMAHSNISVPDTPSRQSAFEVDTRVTLTQQLENPPSAFVMTAFSSNSTTVPESFLKATVQNTPLITPKNTDSIAETAHLLIVDKLKQKSGLSDLLYCNTHKTETTQQENDKKIINTYFNTKCDAVGYADSLPQPIEKIADCTDKPGIQLPLSGNANQGDTPPSLLLSSVPFSDCAAIPERKIIPANAEEADQTGASSSGFYTLLNAVSHVIDTADDYLSQYDPIYFPGAEAYQNQPINKNQLTDPEKHKFNHVHNDAKNKVNLNQLIKNGREALFDFYEKYESDHSTLEYLANKTLSEKIEQRFHLKVDPEETYFIFFNDVMYLDNEKYQYNPRGKKTLSACLFTNFGADIQNNLQDMDQMCGIYDSLLNDKEKYNTKDAVKIKPTDFIQLVWDIDFYNYARKKLTASFSDKAIHIKKYFIDIVNHINTIDNASAKDVLSAVGILKDDNVSVTLFDINGYPAANAFVIRNKNGRVILYLPHTDDRLKTFRSDFDMRSWVSRLCLSEEHRDLIASHFTIKNRQDGIIFSGVDTWLKKIGQDSNYHKIATKSTPIPAENFFEFLFDRMKDKKLSDLDSLVNSDAEVRFAMWENMIDSSNILPNPVSPFLSLGMHIGHIINADTYEDKMNEWHKVEEDLVNIFILIVLDESVKSLNTEEGIFIANVKNRMNNEGIKLKDNFYYDDEIMSDDRFEYDPGNKCYRIKRGLGFADLCSGGAEKYPVIGQGSISTVYDTGEGYVVKKYTGKIDSEYKSRLLYAKNNAKGFNKYYGESSGFVSVSPNKDGTATVSARLKKIDGVVLNEISTVSDKSLLTDMLLEMRAKKLPENLANHLKNKGIMHYDINQGNIIYSKEKGFSIIDFDSAMFASENNPISQSHANDMKNKFSYIFSETKRDIVTRLAQLNQR